MLHAAVLRLSVCCDALQVCRGVSVCVYPEAAIQTHQKAPELIVEVTQSILCPPGRVLHPSWSLVDVTLPFSGPQV